ncbi:type I restriction enzyme endonuclease domain-containing protein [Alkalibacterium iburiense]|uniref:type I restriction enzyme endonuclease domain-containing protein n=1 Tax=Alkalibacterium iburiense TaxID=290589 RepID=UPI003CD061D7
MYIEKISVFFFNSLNTNQNLIYSFSKKSHGFRKKYESLGFSRAEMAFYHVLSNPKNVQDFYTNNQLIQLPKELMASFADETTSD